MAGVIFFPTVEEGRVLGFAYDREETGSEWAFSNEAAPKLAELGKALCHPSHGVPFIADTAALKAIAPAGVRLVAVEGDTESVRPAFVGSTSMQLAVALEWASRLMCVDLPANVWASATVKEDGTLLGVGGFPDKLKVMPEGARVIVASGQENVGDDARVERVATLREAITALWPLPPRDADPVRAKANVLFVLYGTGHQPWGALGEGLRRGHTLGALTDAMVAITQRHLGQHVPIPDPSAAGELVYIHRMVFAAHVIQGLNEWADPQWRTLKQPWEALLPRPELYITQHLRILGALGRLHAAWRDYATAEAYLRQAIDGWNAHDQIGEASIPVCELLRVVGIRGTLCADDVALAMRVADHTRDESWIVRALYRAAATADPIAWAPLLNRLEGVIAPPSRYRALRSRAVPPEFAELLDAARTGDAANSNDDDARKVAHLRGEIALSTLLLDPSDTAALAELTGPQRRRLEASLKPGEALGTALAREWPY